MMGAFLASHLTPGQAITVYDNGTVISTGVYISSADQYLVWVPTGGTRQVLHLGDGISVTF